MHAYADRQVGKDLRHLLLQRLAKFQKIGARFHSDRDGDGGLAVEAKQVRRWIGVPSRNSRHIRQCEEAIINPKIDCLEAGLRCELAADPHADPLRPPWNTPDGVTAFCA